MARTTRKPKAKRAVISPKPVKGAPKPEPIDLGSLQMNFQNALKAVKAAQAQLEKAKRNYAAAEEILKNARQRLAQASEAVLAS